MGSKKNRMEVDFTAGHSSNFKSIPHNLVLKEHG